MFQIPLNLLLKLYELDGDALLMSSLIENHDNITMGGKLYPLSINTSRQKGSNISFNSCTDDADTNHLARSGTATLAKSAGCQPIESVVPLLRSDSLVRYVPECTLAKRCGGCCGSPLAECQPTEVDKVTMNVRQFSYNTNSGKFMRLDDVPVIVDVHQKCACGCRVKEADCNRYQEYNQQECACRCTNMADHKACSEVSTFSSCLALQSL